MRRRGAMTHGPNVAALGMCYAKVGPAPRCGLHACKRMANAGWRRQHRTYHRDAS